MSLNKTKQRTSILLSKNQSVDFYLYLGENQFSL